MKYISLITILFICITHTGHGMEKTPEEITRLSELCIHAVNDRNAIELKKALDAGADVNYKDSDGKSLFYLASQTSNNMNQLLNELIMHENIDLSSRDLHESTPLHWACKLGLTPTVQSMLIKNPQAANMYDKNGAIPLLTAAYFGKKDCVTLLLSHNIKTINHQNYNGYTALHDACCQKHLSIVKLLIEEGANPTIKNYTQAMTPLMLLCLSYAFNWDAFYAFINDHPSIAHELIHAKDAQNNSQLHLCTAIDAILTSKFDLYLQFLTSHGLDIHSRNNDGKTAMGLACDEYNTCYNQYIAKKKSKLKEIVTTQEKIMHAFLRLTSPHTPCVLFKHILHQHSADGLELPEELIALIMCDYYALNIETIVAQKYRHDNTYYDDYIENKQKIRQQLLAKPKPKLLWSA